MFFRNPELPLWVVIVCTLIILLSCLELWISYVVLSSGVTRAYADVGDTGRALFYGSIFVFGLLLSVAWLTLAVMLFRLDKRSVRYFYWLASIGLISGILRFILLLNPPSYFEQLALYEIASRWPLDLVLLLFFATKDKSPFQVRLQN